MPWIRLEVGLQTHRKTRRLAREMGVEDLRVVVGALFQLWAAVRVNAADGCLEGWTPEDLAFEMGFPEADGDRLAKAMLAAGFLDRQAGGVLVCHEWMEHNGEHLREAKRVRDARRKRASEREDEPGDLFAPGDVRPTSGERSANVLATGRDGTGRDETRDSKDRAGGAFDRSPELDPRVRNVAREVANVLRMPPSVTGKLDVEPIARLSAHLGKDLQKAAIQCAHGIWNSGCRHQGLVERLVGYAIAHAEDIRSMHAYLNPKSPHFSAMKLATAGDMSADEGQAFKELERRLASQAR